MTLSKRDADAIKASAPGAKARLEREAAARRDWHANYVAPPEAEWTTVEEVEVLRVGDSRFVGVPTTGRRAAANFVVIDLNDRDQIVCQLKRNEVRGWLARASKEG